MTSDRAFVNALREVLGLAPLEGEHARRLDDVERFGGAYALGAMPAKATPARGADTRRGVWR